MSDEVALGVLGVSLVTASLSYLYYYRSRLGLLYPTIISGIITPIVIGLSIATIGLALTGLYLYSAIVGIATILIVSLPILLVKYGVLSKVSLDPYTWAVEVERRLTEPGPLDCSSLRSLLGLARNTYFYDSLAGILYDHYLRDPGEFLAMISALTMCAPTQSIEIHRRLSKMIVAEAESGIPFAYARTIIESYKDTILPLDIVDYLTNTCIVACTSYGRIDYNCRELLIETLNHYARLCELEPSKVKDSLIDLLKAIRGQVIVRKTSGKQYVGISISGKIIAYNDEWSKLLPCLEKTEEKIMI